MSDLTAATSIGRANDTIVAIATGAGPAAISVIRLTGPRAHEIAQLVVSRWPEVARSATLTSIHDAGGQVLDEAIVTRFDAPRSFTGEDMVEVGTHGGTVVPASVAMALIAAGARQALPGEFTRRALLNGKLDLAQAEATGDLIAAKTTAAQRAALDQLDGGLSRRILAIRKGLLALEAMLAYDIDFPEEDDGPISRDRIDAAINAGIESLDDLVATARAGELVRDGALVVLAGRPNAGKSSIFNALIGRKRAIVTPIPGTTRDAIEALLDAGRWPLRLVDTAGLRESSDEVERLGVEVAQEYLGRADVVLACADSVTELNLVSDQLASLTSGAIIAVASKSDLVRHDASHLTGLAAASHVIASAETGAGISALTDAIFAILDRAAGPRHVDTPLLTKARHVHVAQRALAELLLFRDATADGAIDSVPASIAAIHVRTAVEALEDLIGLVDVEQILDELFSRFCIGK